MSAAARSILIGLAFVAALAAVLFGLCRRRTAGADGAGPFAALRKAFWSAAGLLLGTTSACGDGQGPDPEPTCYVPAWDGREVPPDDAADAADTGPEAAADADADADADAETVTDGRDEGIWVECHVPVDDAGEDLGELDAEADGAGEAASSDVEQTCYFAASNAAPDDRRDRWARRTLLRAQAVEQLLALDGTHPAVRAVLMRDLAALRARVRRLSGG